VGEHSVWFQIDLFLQPDESSDADPAVSASEVMIEFAL